MRPDSQLYIVPFEGGAARRMHCNLPRMNSWHSFSPNGRWLVFSSKSRSLYTQMYLTHIDENGNDSPAILIDNATAANRAVNIPEFVNIPKGGLERIDAPVTEFYRIFTLAYDTMKKNQFAEAIPLWRKALLLDPDDGKAHYNLAVSLTRTGQPSRALPEYRKAADLTPDAARFAGYAWALAQNGNAGEAIEYYRKALALDPAQSSSEAELGVALVGKGLTSEGLDHLNKAVALAPDSPVYHYDLGHALAQGDHLADAIAEYRKSLDLDPMSAATESELGVVLFKTGQPEEAMAHLNKAIELAPASADAHDKLGTALAETGHVSDAETHLRKAVALDPGSLEYRFNLAFLLERTGNFAGAIPQLEKAVQLSGGKDARCLALLAAAYNNTGRPAEAKQAVERALAVAEKDNNTELVKTLRAALERYQR